MRISAAVATTEKSEIIWSNNFVIERDSGQASSYCLPASCYALLRANHMQSQSNCMKFFKLKPELELELAYAKSSARKLDIACHERLFAHSLY